MSGLEFGRPVFEDNSRLEVNQTRDLEWTEA